MRILIEVALMVAGLEFGFFSLCWFKRWVGTSPAAHRIYRRLIVWTLILADRFKTTFVFRVIRPYVSFGFGSLIKFAHIAGKRIGLYVHTLFGQRQSLCLFLLYSFTSHVKSLINIVKPFKLIVLRAALILMCSVHIDYQTIETHTVLTIDDALAYVKGIISSEGK